MKKVRVYHLQNITKMTFTEEENKPQNKTPGFQLGHSNPSPNVLQMRKQGMI